VIDSPEAVVEHMETLVLPGLEERAERLRDGGDTTEWRKSLIEQELECQQFFGPAVLKSPYGPFQHKPVLRYGTYGYANYFMAYALYPEIWESDFTLQADIAVACNRVSAEAIIEGGLPRVVRFDHDMADSRGTLVNVATLDAIWFPHFARSIEPLLDAGVRIIWHCDGNLMQMVPRLIEAGVSGFQGFQYEDGMDYEKICKMTDRNGDSLMIWGGVSVTTTLPHGTKDDVAKQVKWLVENGPEVGLVLSASSSITPGTPRENVLTMIEGLRHYREHGREGL